MAGKSLDERLIERMLQLEENYRDVLEARAKNRASLRNLLDEGMLTPDQETAVLEVYPPRAARGTLGEVA